MKYYEGITKKIELLEQKNAIFYAKPGGKLYNWFKFIYIAIFIYGNFNTLAYVLGVSITYREHLGDFLWDILTPAICTVLMLAGLVCILKKWHIAGASLTVPSAVVLVFFFKYRLADELTIDSVFPKYYWRHLVPMLVIILCVLWLTGIAVRAHLKFRSQYIRVTENLYNLYKRDVTDGKEISEEEWEEFLEKYNPFIYTPQFIGNMKKEENSEG